MYAILPEMHKTQNVNRAPSNGFAIPRTTWSFIAYLFKITLEVNFPLFFKTYSNFHSLSQVYFLFISTFLHFIETSSDTNLKSPNRVPQ